MPMLSRFFYEAVGRQWLWRARNRWTDFHWARYTAQESISTLLFSVDGIPAGFAELSAGEVGAVEICYFGLLPMFVGQHLGTHFLSRVVEHIWNSGASRIYLYTCSTDHPAALPNYIRRGFHESSTTTVAPDLAGRPITHTRC